MSIANPPGAMTKSQAAEKIRGILSEPSTPTEPQNEAQPQPDIESKEPETPTGDTEALSRRRKAKLGDREIEFEVLTDDVDLDLIPTGLMMENDYRQKTMSLAEERKSFESSKSDFDSKLAELTDMVMLGAEELESDEMKELKETNPDEYWAKFDQVKTKAEKLKKYKESRDSELLEKQKKLIEEETSKYTQLIPEWLDEGTKQKDAQMMAEFMRGSGFSDEEIGGLYDARALSLVRKAALYDQIKAQDLSKKKVKEVPKSTPPSAKEAPKEVSDRRKAIEKLKKTGKMNDATEAIKRILFE